MSDILKMVGALVVGIVIGFFVCRGLSARDGAHEPAPLPSAEALPSPCPEVTSPSESECQDYLAKCYTTLDACKRGYRQQ